MLSSSKVLVIETFEHNPPLMNLTAANTIHYSYVWLHAVCHSLTRIYMRSVRHALPRDKRMYDSTDDGTSGQLMVASRCRCSVR